MFLQSTSIAHNGNDVFVIFLLVKRGRKHIPVDIKLLGNFMCISSAVLVSYMFRRMRRWILPKCSGASSLSYFGGISISATPPSRVLVIVPFWYVSLLSLYVLVISSMYMFHPVFFRTRFLLRTFFGALLNNLLFSRFSENTHRGGKCRSRRIGERLDIIAALRILFIYFLHFINQLGNCFRI